MHDAEKREKVISALEKRYDPERDNLHFVIIPNGLVQDALALLKEQEARWIPVTERLPEDGDRVAAICYDGYIECCEIGHSSTGEMQWWGAEQWYKTKHIKYWMPLPEPPKEEDYAEKM